MRTRHVSFVACLLVVLFGRGVARADSRHPIVLEVYTREKPPDADRLIAPVIDELAKQDFDGGSDLGRRFENDVSKPAISAAGLPRSFASDVDRAHDQLFAAGAAAKAAIVPLVEGARLNPGVFADQAKAKALQKALIAFAIAQKNAGDLAAAKEGFRELVRSFPDALVPRSVYGADNVSYFDEAKRDVDAGAHRSLVVEVSSGGALYVNENFRDNGVSMTVTLPAGEYRVFAKLNNGQLSRSHRVAIGTGDVKLGIVPGFDAAVRTQPWTGLVFPNDTDRSQLEGTYAREFCLALDAAGVATVGIGEFNGKRVVVSALIDKTTGSDIRRASVAWDSSTDQLRSLARFIAGGGETPAGVMLVPLTKAAPPRDDGATKIVATPHDDRGERGGSFGAGPWKWVAGGTAVVALGIAGGLLYYNGKCSQPVSGTLPCPDVYNYAVPGYLTLGAGAALAAVTVYLFLRTDRPPAHTAFVAPAPGGAVAGFATSF